MAVRRVLALFKKELKRVVREPAILFVILLFPVVLTLAFGAAFGSFGEFGGETRYAVGFVDYDNSTWSQRFQGNLSETDLLAIQPYPATPTGNASAWADLEQGRVAAVVVVPTGFGASCEAFHAGTWQNATVALAVDQGSLVASQAVPPLIQQVLVTTLLGPEATSAQLPVTVGRPTFVSASKYSQFDYMVPGLVAYAGIFLTMSVSQAFTAEREKGLLKRLQVTPTSPSEIISSQFLANAVTGVVQVVLVFLMASLMGFRPSTSAAGLLLAGGMGLVFALCNVGFGLITASVAKNSEVATGVSFIFILPQMFFGSFVPAPDALRRVVPSHYLTDSLTSILLRGADLGSAQIWINFAILGLFTIVAAVLGILLFRKYGNR